jgi:riboflavin synthase
MFTGIIETAGVIKNITPRANNRIISIKGLLEVKPGDSVSVDGCCLTVLDFRSGVFRVEATNATITTTTIQSYRPGAVVNLERALLAHDRLGGHLVSGHIDEVGTIRKIIRQPGFSVFEIEVSKANAIYLIEKGSVAVDGISLTVAGLKANAFSINIIPYTIEHTNLRKKTIGGTVNIEFDMVGKYIQKFINR